LRFIPSAFIREKQCAGNPGQESFPRGSRIGGRNRFQSVLWQGRRESDNVQDVRRSGGGRIAVGGGIGGVILVVAYLLLGGDPAALVDSQQSQTSSIPAGRSERAA
jgi:hypothetical protein